MLKRLFAHLLPTARLSRPAQVVWLLVLILSPVAYLASFWLSARVDPNTQIDLQVDRVAAIRQATGHAQALGLETANWTSGAKVEVNNDRYYYYHLHENAEAALARRAAPEITLAVIFVAPDQQETLLVRMDRAGQLLGFARTVPAAATVPDPGEPAARTAAAAAFRAWQQSMGLPDAPAPVLTEDRRFDRVTRKYTWSIPAQTLPSLELRTVISVLGERVIAQETQTQFDSAYARDNFVNQQIPAIVLVALYGLLLFLLAVYGIYRYIRRTLQKEVAHARSLLLGAVTFMLFVFIALQSQFHIFNPALETGQVGIYWIILISTFMFFLALGLVMGLAYGSGEGDVREAYPGKLTSLDALLTGRVFSRNVARAVCVGFAFGGWMRLVKSLVLLPWSYSPATGAGLAEHFFGIFFGYFSWTLPLVSPPIGAIQIATLGLLLPLSFLLRRRFRSERWLFGLLILLSLIASFNVFQEQPLPLFAGLLMAALRVAALLFLFFKFDLLTAIISFTSLSLATFIQYFVAQPVPSLQRAGLVAAGITLIVLAAAIFFLARGREYREDEVRPLYARYLAERLRLKAEVSAAREAQVRLLPQRLPKVSGLSVAAACHPAREVGGDFYDLFALDEQRLALFVAAGGGRGLDAALTIAFAKGFLMPRIVAGHTPAEIICDLQEKLATMLKEDQELALICGVIDTTARELNYARAGRYPQVRVNRDGNRRNERKDVLSIQPDEREVQLSSAPGITPQCRIHEATMPLAPGDIVMVVTDGIVANLQSDQKRTTVEQWAGKVVLEGERNNSNSLQESLDKALRQRARRAKRSGLEDDLTAVLIHLPNGEGQAR